VEVVGPHFHSYTSTLVTVRVSQNRLNEFVDTYINKDLNFNLDEILKLYA